MPVVLRTVHPMVHSGIPPAPAAQKRSSGVLIFAIKCPRGSHRSTSLLCSVPCICINNQHRNEMFRSGETSRLQFFEIVNPRKPFLCGTLEEAVSLLCSLSFLLLKSPLRQKIFLQKARLGANHRDPPQRTPRT